MLDICNFGYLKISVIDILKKQAVSKISFLELCFWSLLSEFGCSLTLYYSFCDYVLIVSSQKTGNNNNKQLQP